MQHTAIRCNTLQHAATRCYTPPRRHESQAPNLEYTTARRSFVTSSQGAGHSATDLSRCVSVCCSVLQCGAVCCSALHCAATCCPSLVRIKFPGCRSYCNRPVAVCCSMLQCGAVWCSDARVRVTVQQTCCSVLQCVAVCCSVLQCVAV